MMQDAGATGSGGRSTGPPWEVAGRTDIGRVRPGNEDALRLSPEAGLVVVADGMGGGPAGEVASSLAAESVLRDLEGAGAPSAGPEERDLAGSRPPPSPEAPPPARMEGAILRAQERLLEEIRGRPGLRGMGTTLTALEVRPGPTADKNGGFVVGHVGDSRAYRFRGGRLERLTRDHTQVQDAVEAGHLSAEEARVHPARHVLTMVLGVEAPIEPQIVEGPADPGDLFLLCSDGLTEVLSDGQIEEVLGREARRGLEAVVAELVDGVNDRGSPDNVTVALLRIP